MEFHLPGKMLYRVMNKRWTHLTNLPLLNHFPALLKILDKKKIKGVVFHLRWEHTMTVKDLKIIGKWSKRGKFVWRGVHFLTQHPVLEAARMKDLKRQNAFVEPTKILRRQNAIDY